MVSLLVYAIVSNKSNGGSSNESIVVNDSSFTNNEVIYTNIPITANSLLFRLDWDNGGTGNSFNFLVKKFNLDLDSSYVYTFEITAANFVLSGTDTLIGIFDTQNLQPDTDISQNLVIDNDDGGEGLLSKLTNQVISADYSFLVSSIDPQDTGTFTLKITRSVD